eukprot:12899146-Prorocentrum_lima.AAC.1
MPVDAALARPASPAAPTPPPPAPPHGVPPPHRVPPPPGTALAALFPYVVPEVDATVMKQLQRVTAKAHAKAAAALIPTPVRAGAAAASST